MYTKKKLEPAGDLLPYPDFRICNEITFLDSIFKEVHKLDYQKSLRYFVQSKDNFSNNSIEYSLCRIPSHRNSESFSVLEDVLQNPTTLLVSPNVERQTKGKVTVS